MAFFKGWEAAFSLPFAFAVDVVAVVGVAEWVEKLNRICGMLVKEPFQLLFQLN